MSVAQRKDDHIAQCLKDPAVDRCTSGFDSITLAHRALPELDFDKVDTSITFLGKKLSFPFMLSSMTGGTSKETITINQNLAMAAEECKVALAVGSQRVMFEDKEAEKSFKLREFAPSVPLIANLGAVQLNYGFSIDECRKAVKVLDADALFLHLNPLQEVIQKGGNRNFEYLSDKIKSIRSKLEVPLMIKETGCGLSEADYRLLINCGIRYIDVAGRGGTSWSRIEHLCNKDDSNLGLAFQDWGLTTVETLEQVKPFRNQLFLIAGGGIRSGIDLAKAMSLGASMGSSALPFLKAALESKDAVEKLIEEYREQFKVALFLTGHKNCKDE
jgi:isopentenyl-diphosphate delta-isomerase